MINHIVFLQWYTSQNPTKHFPLFASELETLLIVDQSVDFGLQIMKQYSVYSRFIIKLKVIILNRQKIQNDQCIIREVREWIYLLDLQSL